MMNPHAIAFVGIVLPPILVALIALCFALFSSRRADERLDPALIKRARESRAQREHDT